MTFDPVKISKQLLDDGEAWADANAAASVLEEGEKSLLSQIALSIIKDAGSVAKAEMIARASPEYTTYIAGMVEARRISNRAKVRYDTDKAYVELLRSQESTLRASMNLR